ncbi:MAG: class I SAM-dependent DNA methyltransferase [Phycisphaerales bacterium]|nr:class I SAM-dependent DNA methyltransferase [Phycisphaerales bacterium]
MQLSWNEIRQRSVTFAREWSGATRERAEAQTFWNEFFSVFGIRRRTVAAFEEPVRGLTGTFEFIDLFWKGKLLAEHKSRGGSLLRAHCQAVDYIQRLHDDARSDEVPRYVIVSDFARIALHDLEAEDAEHRSIEFALADFPNQVRHFAFIAGYETLRLDEEDPANFRATELLANLHDRLEDGGYTGHDLQRFMVRILFCLFAEDTGIFEPDMFRHFILNRTREDGSDTGAQLNRLFEVLNQLPEVRQANLDEDLVSLPFVNGELFAERLSFADFNRGMRTALLECCRFRWEKISPAVFGSLFQNIMQPRQRRQIGAHYTSERDIMKLIRSLFLDDLRTEFESIRRDRRALAMFHRRLGEIRMIDPACGCGNFLVIAYRELRRLELDVIQARFGDNPSEGDIRGEARLNVSQFHGIEIEEWAVRIAEVAMWLMDHQMNAELFARFAQVKATTPLVRSPRTVHTNALRIDWNEVLPAEQCTYILGNPPFVGKKARNPSQIADMQHVFGGNSGSGTLDYVCCWYAIALKYMRRNPAVRASFVSTNSITQGEQAGILWPLLFGGGLSIGFAHRTFAWVSEARGGAHVHVVIIGFSIEDTGPKFIWEYDADPERPVRSPVPFIGPYLVSARSVLPNRTRPISRVPAMKFGNMPNDDGNLLLETRDACDEIVESCPEAAPFIREIICAREFLNGKRRWCLWLVDAPPAMIRRCLPIRRRVEAVRRYRSVSNRMTTRSLAESPALFGELRQPTSRYVLIPRHSSEKRAYVPMSYFDADVIAHDSCLTLPNASLYHFGVLSSAMHMAWVRQVCGRLESRYRYSAKLVYNNYPWPTDVTDAQRRRVAELGQAVLDARSQHPDATLADLYDPDAMPPALRRAHDRLDRAVDACYRRQPFDSERQRLEHLFELYEQLVSPLVPVTRRARPKRRA